MVTDGERETAKELLRALEEASTALLRAQCRAMGWEHASGMALDDLRAGIDAARNTAGEVWCEARSLLGACEREAAGGLPSE